MMAHDAIDQILARINDRGGLIHDRGLVLRLLSSAQQATNGATRDVRGSASFSTVPTQPFYRLSEVLPSCLTLETVEVAGQELDQIPFSALSTLDANWIRIRADRPDYWATVGKDLLVLYPAAGDSVTVTGRYVSLLPVVTSENDELVLPSERLDQLFDLVDSVLFLRERKFGEMDVTLARITGASVGPPAIPVAGRP